MTAPAAPATAVTLAEVQESLLLFAEAIAGRPVPIEAVEDGERCWPWRASDARAAHVALPPELDAFGSRDANRLGYRCIVLHQLLGGGVPLTAAPDVRGIYEILEDLRVDAVTAARFPGAAAGIGIVTEQARHDVTGAPDVYSALRLRSLGADSADLGTSPLIEAALAEADSVDRSDAGPADSWRAARRIAELLAAAATPAPSGERADHDDPTEPPAVVTDGSGASLDQSGTPSELEQSDSLVGGAPAEDPHPDVVESADPGGEPDPLGMPFDRAGATSMSSAIRTFVYDEWDYHRQRHRSAWCRVVEERSGGEDHGFIASVRTRHADLRAEIRRRFSRLRPDDLVRVHRCDDGDELDLDAAIEAIVDRRSGAPMHDRVHVRRDRAARDVSAAFLLDLSASTSSPVEPDPPRAPQLLDPAEDLISYAPLFDDPPSGAEPARRVIDVAKDAVALMSDALHELGDQHSIYGFSGQGRLEVDFIVAKDFADPVSAKTWAAVAAMEPRQYTRMGPAIRHATAKLRHQQSRTKVLVVISDGYPQDTDYGDDRSDKDYGIHDTARALADAGDAGVDTFCVTIDPAGHDYLRRMCPPDRYLIIDDVEALPAALAKVYLALSTR